MKPLALVLGALLVLAGAAGFVPALTPGGLLFGVFAVDAAHNIFHLASGGLGLALGLSGEDQSGTYVRLVGIVYALMAAMGIFTLRSGELLGMAVNMADHAFHGTVAAIALYFGFFRGGTLRRDAGAA